MNNKERQWLIWLEKIQAIAKNGLTFTKDPFDRERYEQLQTLAAELAGSISDLDCLKVANIFAKEFGYATPKIDVRGVAFQDNKILLVKENEDQRWTLPGGWADINYSAAETAAKEVFEESGYEVKVIKLLALYDKHKHPHPHEIPHAYKAFFLCKIIGGSPKASIETSAAKFFNLEELPELSERRVTASQIKRMFEHLQHPNWPTDFD